MERTKSQRRSYHPYQETISPKRNTNPFIDIDGNALFGRILSGMTHDELECLDEMIKREKHSRKYNTIDIIATRTNKKNEIEEPLPLNENTSNFGYPPPPSLPLVLVQTTRSAPSTTIIPFSTNRQDQHQTSPFLIDDAFASHSISVNGSDNDNLPMRPLTNSRIPSLPFPTLAFLPPNNGLGFAFRHLL